MKFSVLYTYFLISVSLIVLLFTSCTQTAEKETTQAETPLPKDPPQKLSSAFRSYWYSGKAEISSYALSQARYGELREGQAVLVFVTEPFNAVKQVKADRAGDQSVSVLKLNSTRKFLTGLYPYSIMSSTFYPVANNQHAIKVTNSVQEWCGQVYAQLNNREEFELQANSYFESEGDQQLKLSKSVLENELWTQLRMDPNSLPQGDVEILPAFEYIRLKHLPFQAFKAKAVLREKDSISTYALKYPELNRKLEIHFRTAFPHEIEGWSESYVDGYGPNAQIMTSTAKKIGQLNSPYWSQNGNVHLVLRDSLGLQ
ncbi:septum formation inhibitor Maf [Aureicoccus marinus]|uniref:Septum formation inhibitor Maf n=1 Tax=Aureicoccus marinus TaxID=754435 RepID=A0A2S7T6B5_9FLAO|nr:septum formation inhibitor Maf [Aureicoccus marinus]PQJ15138.1 septum formation inhibitor Maf [Aureicoccus marinus]